MIGIAPLAGFVWAQAGHHKSRKFYVRAQGHQFEFVVQVPREQG